MEIGMMWGGGTTGGGCANVVLITESTAICTGTTWTNSNPLWGDLYQWQRDIYRRIANDTAIKILRYVPKNWRWFDSFRIWSTVALPAARIEIRDVRRQLLFGRAVDRRRQKIKLFTQQLRRT